MLMSSLLYQFHFCFDYYYWFDTFEVLINLHKLYAQTKKLFKKNVSYLCLLKHNIIVSR